MPSSKRKRPSRARALTKPTRSRSSRPPRRAAKQESRRATSKPAATRSTRPTAAPKLVARTGGVTVTEVVELETLRRELERAGGKGPLRWNADPDDVQRSVAQLVLTLVEFIRKLLERQAIRRMEGGTLTDQQIEDVGRALMTLEETIVDMARRFGLSPDDLNLDLGPIGKLV